MKNIKLTIEYDGTRYNGWQEQQNGLGIQTVITNAVFELTGERIQLNASGRTDAGVHALAQVANFHTNSTIPSERFMYAINGLLPDDIAIVRSNEVEGDFHSRFCAKGKIYRYLIWNSARPNALLSKRAYHIPTKLDLNAMVQASQLFVGEHDFAAFRAQGSSTKTSVRTIFAANVKEDEQIQEDGVMISIELHGSGFLYNMVRIISGTLIEVGLGKKRQSDILNALKTCDRTIAGKTLPPHGLYLKKVFYE